jgi:GAF domain-containing protein
VSEPKTDVRVPETFLQLGMVPLGGSSLDELLDRVVSLAVETLSSARFASLTVSDTKGVRTSHSTGAEALAADEVQYAEHLGPCLEAMNSSRQVNLAIAETAQWPAFKAKAEQLGITSVLSTPLVHRGTTLGALNVYGRDGALAGADRRIATLFADQAAVLVANALALLGATQMTTQLEQALASREIIGEAKGILMERESCDRDQAFDILRRASQRENRKLRDLAEELVAVVEARSRKR